jgi:hypothetical protein
MEFNQYNVNATHPLHFLHRVLRHHAVTITVVGEVIA